MIDASKEKRITVRAQMSRASDDTFRLSIEDSASLLRIIEITMDAAAFADLLSSRSSNAQARVYPTDRVGQRHESREIMVPLGKSCELDAAFWERAERAADGWDVQRERYNGHRVSDGSHEVTLRRWVAP